MDVTDEMETTAAAAMQEYEWKNGARLHSVTGLEYWREFANVALTALAARPADGLVRALQNTIQSQVRQVARTEEQWWPEEPTEEMIQAACDATFGQVMLTPEEMHRLGYAAMRTTRLKSLPGGTDASS